MTLDDRSFTCAAPRLWNALPFDIRYFKFVDVFTLSMATPRVLPWQPIVCHILRKLCRISARKQKGLNTERFLANPLKRKKKHKRKMMCGEKTDNDDDNGNPRSPN